MKLALVCCGVCIARSVGTVFVRAVSGAIDLALWLLDGGER